MHDALHSPGEFNTVYVYEREQRWPWGHRNIVFAQRDGPIVYIKRSFYLNSPWQKTLPVDPKGTAEISPYELWDLLKKYGKQCLLSVIRVQPVWEPTGKYMKNLIIAQKMWLRSIRVPGSPTKLLVHHNHL